MVPKLDVAGRNDASSNSFAAQATPTSSDGCVFCCSTSVAFIFVPRHLVSYPHPGSDHLKSRFPKSIEGG